MVLPTYPLQIFLNNIIVFLGKNENKQHIHLCLTKNDKKSWEDICRQLQDNKFKTTTEEGKAYWEYYDGPTAKLFSDEVNSRIEQNSQKHNSYQGMNQL